jgi:Ser/Thr protein kinase RdoA (MazF antagonist)
MYAEKHGALHGDLHDRNVLVWVTKRKGIVHIMEVSVIDFGTSIFGGKVRSEVRHATLLRQLTF